MPTNSDLKRWYKVYNVEQKDFVRYDAMFRVFCYDAVDDFHAVNLGQMNEAIKRAIQGHEYDINIENGLGGGSLQQKHVKNDIDYSAQATGENATAFGGLRFDYDPTKHSGDTTNIAAGGQSFVAGCGNLAAGDWSFVTGKDNTVYSNRAFVSGGANISQATDSGGNLLEEKTNIGRFNAIFGNNNTFKSSDTSKESNLIAGGSNTVDTERSIVVGYNNNVAGHYDAIFGFTNTVNANYSLTGGQNHIVNGAYHLVAGSGNEVSGQYNIASGQDNENLGWNGAVIGRGLIVGKDHTAQTVLGQYNDNKSNTVFEIGWGSSDNRKNVFEVLQDGRAKVQSAPVEDNDVVRKADLANVGGGKLYKHFITIKFSETKIGYAYLTLVDNYDKSYDINKLNTNYFNNGTVYLICRITGSAGDGVGNITYYNDGFAYVAGIFASGSGGGGTSELTGISEAPLFISSVSDTYTEI